MKTKLCLLLLVTSAPPLNAAEVVYATQTHQVLEWSFISHKKYDKPFTDIQFDVVFTTPKGKKLKVPGFWSGGPTWKARYASGELGFHTYKTVCSDKENPRLHGITGKCEIKPYSGKNPLWLHGPIRVASNKRTFEHADGTPFFWLADTWWMGLCRRFRWPGEFQTLAADRIEKGFNVIQIVAGLYPDMPAFDERGAGYGGFPWEPDYSRINPEYFDLADHRLMYLVDVGLSPCIVGAWGYHLPWMGVERLKQHWRYLVARYGAYPVVWCLAGEGSMPYYLSETKEKDIQLQREGWTEIGKYVREIDPFDRVVSIHPSETSRAVVTDPGILDFDMPQTGHGDRASMPGMINTLRKARAMEPPMPVFNSEVAYEGILDSCYQEIQRFAFWASMMQGMAGHTYGANGIWQVNREGQPYGKSPHGGNWGDTPWNEAMHLPGSRQVGFGKKLLMRYPWYKFEPHPEWASIQQPEQNKTKWGQWIWFDKGNPVVHSPAGKYFFRKSFEIASKPKSAVLHIAVDDTCVVHMNGFKVGGTHGFQFERTMDVTARINPGTNVLAIAAENLNPAVEKNPAGLLCTLKIVAADGKGTTIVSDKTWKSVREVTEDWQSTKFDDKKWPNAMQVAAVGDPPWGQPKLGEIEFQTPYPAGIPNEVRFIYLPGAFQCTVHQIEHENYRAKFVNPINLDETSIGKVEPKDGNWISPEPPEPGHDWILILEKEETQTKPATQTAPEN